MKINLLPGRVQGKGKLAAVWTAVAVLLIAQLVGLSLFQQSLLAKEQQLEADVTAAEKQAQDVQKLEQDAAAERGKIRDIDQKVTFVKNLREYNEQRPNLYQNTAEYTLEGIRYTSMSAANNVLQVQAWAPTLSDAGRYLLYMQNSPDFQTVTISGVPGYPSGGGAGGAAGAPLGDIGAAAGGAMPGGPGGQPGFTGAPPGGPGAMGSDPAGMPPGGQMGGGPGAFGPGGGGPEGPGGPGGGFGGGGGGGGGRSIVGGAFMNSRARNMPPPPPQGFGFTATAVLVKPITRPIYGGQPQQGGFGGMGGGGAFGPEGAMGPGAYGAEPGMMPQGGGAFPPGAGPGAPGAAADVAAGG